MRKVVRTAAMIALLLTTTASIASEPKLSVVPNENVKSFVYELDAHAGRTTIKFMDAEQNVIFFETVEKENYAKKFDLSKLKDGLYFFKSEDDLTTISYTISVNGSNVEVIDKKENSKPVFRQKGGMVYLNLLNLDSKDVDIQVYDSSNRLVFSEKRENEMVIEKAFDFTKAYEGEYTVVVRDSKETYYKEISVN
ncbi:MULTISPECIES: hypothetical protein [Zobellia]|uniref:hypothetical protein n=1 Tax=Zobellia TaxID=112040 RepID=UPI001BFF6134|nr:MULTISPECIES: hypothetical protein [Zobellia]MBT9189727.1 hypothetical protein [Zobellia russellii]MDO6820560.1 hypothetical protein [Zobellia sp. 1_MG-2023]